MRPEFVAFVLASLAVAASYFAKPAGKEFAGDLRILIVWIGAAAIAAFIPIVSVSFGALAMLLLAAAPLNPLSRVCLYIGALTALPSSYVFDLPFPGLNYLIKLDYPKLASLILLGPCLPAALRRPAQGFRTLDLLVLSFFLLKCVLAARALPLTSVIRYAIEHFILIVIPYFTISRILQTREDFVRAFDALFVAILIHAFVGVASTLKDWNFYTEMAGKELSQFDYRGGFLRVTSTLNTFLFGAAMGIGVISAFELKRRRAIGSLRIAAYLPLFAAMCFLSGSRGAVLAALVAAVSYFVFARTGGATRKLFLGAAAVITIVLPSFLMNADFTAIDPYGTFSYRVQLMKATMAHFGEHPVFGSADFSQDPNFAHLVQGQGIIDFVNTYVQVALEYGAAGLILFVAIGVLSVFASARALHELQISPTSDQHRALIAFNGFAAAMNVSMLVLIATVSAVSYTNQMLMLGLALAVGLARISLREAAAARAEAAAAPSAATGAQTDSRPAIRAGVPAHLRQYLP